MTNILAEQKIAQNTFLQKVVDNLKSQSIHFSYLPLRRIIVLAKTENNIWLLNLRTKLIFGRFYFWHKKNPLWIEEPDFDYDNLNKRQRRTFLKCSRRARLICFTTHSQAKLEKIGVLKNNIELIFLGIDLEENKRQDNLFSKIAWQKVGAEKYFSLGTLANLSQTNQVENILCAAKKSLEIIKNLQIIIIGDGQERKNLIWLSQKMGLDHITWFVGQQDNLQKWLDSFNLFITGDDRASLANIEMLLKAGSKGLPTIAFENPNWSDFLINEKTAVFSGANDSESLADHIINLYKNPNLADLIGHNLQKTIKEKFDLEETINNFKKCIK
jgi:glycosyltransferase involved in cell wall biosynthesis